MEERRGTIREFSMTELNNEITRRRMEAERAECVNAEADADAMGDSDYEFEMAQR